MMEQQAKQYLLLFMPSFAFIFLLSAFASSGATGEKYSSALPSTSSNELAEPPTAYVASDSLLLAEVAPRVARDGLVMMALCNAGYMDLLLNWKASVDRLNITNYVIIPNDRKAAQQLSFLGVDWAYDPELGLDDASSSEAAAWTANKNDPMFAKWNRVVHKKAAYVRTLLAMGLDVLVTDVDIVFLKDPLPLFGNKSVDLFFINDHDNPPATGPITYHLLCGGFWLGRNNPRTLAFVDAVQQCERGGTKEQPCFMHWFGKPVSERGGASMQVMSPEDFPSGKYYFTKFWKSEGGTLRKIKEDPYIVHNNWIIGHTEKLKRFAKYGFLSIDVTALNDVMSGFSYDPDLTAYPRLLELHRRVAPDGRQRVRRVLDPSAYALEAPQSTVAAEESASEAVLENAPPPPVAGELALTGPRIGQGLLLSGPVCGTVFALWLWARRRRQAGAAVGAGRKRQGGFGEV